MGKNRPVVVVKKYNGRVPREELLYRLAKLLIEAKMNGRV